MERILRFGGGLSGLGQVSITIIILFGAVLESCYFRLKKENIEFIRYDFWLSG